MAKARKSKSTKNLRDLRDPLDYPETRIERYLKCIKTGDNTDLPSTVNTRIERYLYCIATGDNSTLPDHPETMIELYLDAIATGNVSDLPHDPQDRLQRYLYAAAYVDSSLLPSADYTRLEKYISSILGGITFVTDQTPYLFRVSGGDENANVKHKELDTLVGATMAWNQMIQNGNFADGEIGWAEYYAEATVSDGEIKVVKNSLSGGGQVRQTGTYYTDHKYFLTCEAKTSDESYGAFINFSRSNATTANSRNAVTYNTTFERIGVICSPPESGMGISLRIGISNNPIDIYGVFRNVNVHDLSVDLGPKIADYVYSLDIDTPGAGMAWLKDHGFFTKDYYAHDPGSLQSVCVSAHIMRDADDQIIASYPLDHSVTRRGIYKLDANNKLYADGDTDDGKGTMTVKTVIATYNGTEGGWYEYHADGVNQFYRAINGVYHSASEASAISNKFVGIAVNDRTGNYDTIYTTSNGIAFNVSTSKANTVAEWETWLASNPVTIQYFLTTPTTATVEPFTNPQQVDKNGTEEYVDFPYFVEDRDVEVPVGHITQYPQ